MGWFATNFWKVWNACKSKTSPFGRWNSLTGWWKLPTNPSPITKGVGIEMGNPMIPAKRIESTIPRIWRISSTPPWQLGRTNGDWEGNVGLETSMIPVGNRNLLKGLFFLPKRNTTWKETPLSFHAIVFLSQASLEQQKLLVLGVSRVVFLFFRTLAARVNTLTLWCLWPINSLMMIVSWPSLGVSDKCWWCFCFSRCFYA